jgi:hypothetical protein
MSIAQKGISKLKEHIEKRVKSRIDNGLGCSKETKQKISAALQGKTHTDESKLKMSMTRKGRQLTDEHKLKLSIAAKNRKKR